MKKLFGLALLPVFLIATTIASGGGATRLAGHVPVKQMARARELGRKSASSRVQLAIVLNPSDPVGLESTLQSLYTPGDPLYHQFLSPQQFAARFAPSDQDVDKVSRYLSARGLNVTKAHSNHLVVDVEGPVSSIESAFQIELHEYLSGDGRIVYGPNVEPSVADEIAPNLAAIVGLNNFSLKKPQVVKGSKTFQPNGSGQLGAVAYALTPARLKSVYSLNNLSQTGAGETLALFEMDGYTSSDIQNYESTFSLATPPLTNVLVNGATGIPSSSGTGPLEATMDIELAIAMAPGLSNILVYETTQDDAGFIDCFTKIATDNLATVVSTSWAQAENGASLSMLNSEHTLFQEMAMQGQSVFASSGDSGAYGDAPFDGDSTDLEVADPSSQPYVTGVGGTTVTWNASTNAWISETSWTAYPASGTYGDPNFYSGQGGGGGISNQWTIPSWQVGLSTTANKGSTTMRMVPDVSLNAEPEAGYAVYYLGNWQENGGTSAAAPLWAAFTSLVNQQRVASGLSRIGFANPSIYQIGKGSSYASNFHDISDGSTNLFYPATSGYDLSTGWGSINGSLFSSLVGMILTPIAPTSLTLTPGGLSITASWPAVADASSYTVMKSTSPSGPFSSIATGLTSTSYTDSSLTYGTTYYYYVQAVNTSGTGPASVTRSSSPYPAPPGAPSSLEASPL